MPEETVEKTKQELKNDKIDEAKEQGRKILSKLKDINYSELISDCYTEMDTFIDMVARGISTGCIIEGKPATGKSYRALWRCKDLDYSYMDSFSTPASFYIFLYKNKDKDVVIVDDVASIFKSEKVLAFMKGALWAIDKDNNGKPVRIINYLSTKPLKDEHDEPVPDSFEMNARMIIITNLLNKDNEHLKAVLSRVHYCYVDIPRDELLRILEQITKKNYDGLTLEERKEVLEFLKNNTSESTENFHIRTLLKMMQLKLESKQVGKPELWKILGMKMLKKDDLLVLVEELEKNELLSVSERIIKFEELTGKKRATYFRLKKKIKA